MAEKEDPELSCSMDTVRQQLHVLQLMLKTTRDWQNRSSTARCRHKVTSKRVGGTDASGMKLPE